MPDEPEKTPHGPAIPEWALPMVTNPSDCVRQRLFGLLVIRSLGFAVLASVVFPAVSWLTEGLTDGDLLDLSYYAGRIGAVIALGCIGLGLLFAAGPISRNLVVIQREPHCPGCGFNLTGLVEPRCPECALQFSASGGAGVSRHTAIQYRTWYFAAVLLFRLIAVVLLATGITHLLGYLWWVVYDGANLYYPLLGVSEFLRTSIVIVSGFLPGLLLWWLAPALAGRCLRAGLRPEIEPDDPPR